MDPLFFLLPLLARNGSRFSPLAQYLSPSGPQDAAVSLLQSVEGVHAAMASACDVNDVMGTSPDELLYRLNRPKACGALAARVRRVAGMLQAQAEAQQARLRAQMGSFSAVSTAINPAASPSSSSGSAAAASSSGDKTEAPLSPEHLLTALGLLSEYMDDGWTEEVAGVLGWVKSCLTSFPCIVATAAL